MIRACQEMITEGYNREMSEDILFTYILRKGEGYVFPTMKECNEFALESFGNVETCIGVHGTDKYYMSSETKTALEPFLKSPESK